MASARAPILIATSDTRCVQLNVSLAKTFKTEECACPVATYPPVETRGVCVALNPKLEILSTKHQTQLTGEGEEQKTCLRVPDMPIAGFGPCILPAFSLFLSLSI